jgi:N-acetylmuramoyl-L-alanine amidase
VSEIRSILVGLALLSDVSDTYDEAAETAVRAFQQSRGIGVDGVVGEETWQALDGARGSSVPNPVPLDPVRAGR